MYKIPFFLLLLTVLTLSCAFLDSLISPNTRVNTNTSIQTQTAASSIPTETMPPATSTWTPQPSLTITPNKTATRAAWNATAQAKLTQTAKPMADLVQNLFEEGYISSNQGTVKNIKEFSEAWAQLNWYRWWYQLDERKYSNFILSFDAEMKSASDKANWNFAGCGIVFHTLDEDNYFVLFIAQDGTLRLSKWLNDVGSSIKKTKPFTTNTPVENLNVVLIVEGIQVYVFVDGNEVLSARDPILISKLDKGKIGFSVTSGTNKGYGTRCTMKNIQFWEIK